MLRSAATSRRLATTVLRPLRTTSRQPFTNRQISFLPWRRQNTSPPLPVYFPKPPPKPRFRNAGRRIGRFVLAGFVFYTCWQIFAFIVIDPLLDWADSEWESLSEKEKKEVENQASKEGNHILFLPFPFTTKEVEQPPYKGSDPEWQAFLTINKDSDLQKALRVSLAEFIRRAIETHPKYSKVLGGKDIKIKKIWLDIVYPDNPPPKHYISGLIIDDTGIYWGARPINSVSAGHLNNVIYPKLAVAAAWSFLSTLVTQTASDVGKFFNSSPPETETTWQSVMLNRMKEKEGGGPSEKNIMQPQPRPPTISTKATGDFRPPSGESQADSRVVAALQAAGTTLAKGWKPVMPPPGRGCILVDGLVELQGPDATMVVYAMAWYDPKQKKYTETKVMLKHLLQHRQKPAKG